MLEIYIFMSDAFFLPQKSKFTLSSSTTIHTKVIDY